MKRITVLLLALTVTLLSGCTSLLTDSKNVSNQKYSYKKILVVAKSKDDVTRRIFEDNVADELAKQGINAVSSAIYGLKVDKKLTEEQIKQLKETLKNDGYDGVILTSLVDAQNYVDVVQGTSSVSAGYYGGGFRGGYAAYPVTYWEPDHIVSGTTFILQSTLYNIAIDANNLQWAGRFEVDSRFDLKSAKEKYPEELVQALMKDSIIKPLTVEGQAK